MLDVVVNAALFGSGFVLLLAAVVVLKTAPRLDLSLRTVAAILIGIGGAVQIADAISVEPLPAWEMVALPLGIALWVGRALYARRGQQMRRESDWASLDGIGDPGELRPAQMREISSSGARQP